MGLYPLTWCRCAVGAEMLNVVIILTTFGTSSCHLPWRRRYDDNNFRGGRGGYRRGGRMEQNGRDRGSYNRDRGGRDRGSRYGAVRRETFLNGSYSDYMKEFHGRNPPVMPGYGPPPPGFGMDAPPQYPYERSREFPPMEYPQSHSRSRERQADKRSYERDVDDFLRRTRHSDSRDRRERYRHDRDRR